MLEIWPFFIFAFFAASFATIAGFGSSTLLIPVALFFMDFKIAILVVACFHLFNNLFKVRLFFKGIDLRICLWFGIPSIMLSFTGALMVDILPEELLKNLVAWFLIIFSIYSLIKPKFKIKDNPLNAIIGGGLSGLLAGLIGMGGALRAMFLINYKLSKEVYIASSALIALVIDLTRIPTYFVQGKGEVTFSLVLLPALIVVAYFGVKLGRFLLDKIDQEIFRKFVLATLLILGIQLLLSNIL